MAFSPMFYLSEMSVLGHGGHGGHSTVEQATALDVSLQANLDPTQKKPVLLERSQATALEQSQPSAPAPLPGSVPHGG